MFSFLKKKKFQSDWCIWFCLIEGKPASITVDYSAYNKEAKAAKNLVVLTIFDLGTSRNGFPERDIFDELYTVENKLELAANSFGYYPGRFVTDGNSYYLFYTKNVNQMKKNLDFVMANTKHRYTITSKEDPYWKIYFDMLYPPPKEKQKYDNGVIIRKLIESGSNPTKKHILEHLVLFSTEKDQKSFLTQLKKEKNILTAETKMYKDSGFNPPFALEVKISLPLEERSITQATDVLLALAEKYNAIYDGWGAEVEK